MTSKRVRMGKNQAHDNQMQFYRTFANLSLDTQLALGLNFSEFIKSCSFGGLDCLQEEFFLPMISPAYGVCYIFNSNITSGYDTLAGRRTSTLTGPNYGLSLVLFLDTLSYMPSTVAQTLGARAVIHGNDKFPLVGEAGFDFSPAAVTSVSLSETRVMRQPAPYISHCFANWSEAGVQPGARDTVTQQAAPTNEAYSLSECHRICLQLNFIETCSCHHTLYPIDFFVDGVPQDIKQPCDLSFVSSDSNCTTQVVSSMKTSDPDADCRCSVPCSEVVYEPQMAVAEWPQGYYLDSLLQSFDMQSSGVSDLDADELARMYAKLNVYFRSLNSAAISENAMYTDTKLISSLGGALSLYLGIAMILVVEVLEFMFFVLYNTVLYCAGRYPQAAEPTHIGAGCVPPKATYVSPLPGGGKMVWTPNLYPNEAFRKRSF